MEYVADPSLYELYTVIGMSKSFIIILDGMQYWDFTILRKPIIYEFCINIVFFFTCIIHYL